MIGAQSVGTTRHVALRAASLATCSAGGSPGSAWGSPSRSSQRCGRNTSPHFSLPARPRGLRADPASAAVGLAGSPLRRGRLGHGRRPPTTLGPCRISALVPLPSHHFLAGWGFVVKGRGDTATKRVVDRLSGRTRRGGTRSSGRCGAECGRAWWRWEATSSSVGGMGRLQPVGAPPWAAPSTPTAAPLTP